MSTHTIDLNVYEIHGTDKAILITLTPKSRDPNPTGIWIPKSQIEHITRHTPLANEWRQITITIPEWLAEKKGLI